MDRVVTFDQYDQPMLDAWSHSLVLLYQPKEPVVRWPAESCRFVKLVSCGDTPGGLAAGDEDLLFELRQKDRDTRALARALFLPRGNVLRRLIRLRTLGLVSGDSHGVWRALLDGEDDGGD